MWWHFRIDILGTSAEVSDIICCDATGDDAVGQNNAWDIIL